MHLVDISEQKKYTTELKNRENALLSSKSKLENIIEGTNVGTWEWNMQTGELNINETWANIIGYSASELQPTTIDTWLKLAHPEDLKNSKEQINLHIRQRIPYYDIDCRMKHKFGHWVWIHDRGQIKSYSPDGKPLMMFGTHEDISKRKEQENIINLAKESYFAIFNSLTEAIYIMDENLVFIDVNKGAEKMYQYSRKELIGKQPKDLQAKGLNDENLIYKLLNDVKNNGKSVTFDFWAVRKNGEIFPKEVYVNKGVYFGKDVLIATARDILDKKNYEARINSKNEELKKLNSEKDKFFSILAHDLKSPFNGFLGLTKVLSEQSKELSTEDIQRIAYSLNKSATNLNNLLENLLQWSMIKQGKLTLNRKLISVPKTVENCIEYFNESIQSKALNILVNIPSEIYLNADENCLKSIIRNLLNNAIKFSHPNGKILISAEFKGSVVMISLKDFGIGMNNETLNNLFTLNSISKRSGTHNEKSSGLGLLLVKEFLDLHHGSVNIESTENQGSCFSIFLPMD